MADQQERDPALKSPDILDWSLEELRAFFRELGQPAFRAEQVYNWIFHKGAASFQEMTNLPKELRARLEEAFTISALSPEETLTSQDKTQKLLYRLKDGERIESVLIPERDHWTLCASSQAGCAMGCRFCLTGQGGLRRDLTPAEIIAQVRAALNLVQEMDPAGPKLRNIVFMGMGEPLANLENLLKSLAVITDPRGLAFAWRRVTVSTVGLVPSLERLMREVKVRLAVSLNGADDRTRSLIMPVNRRYPLGELIPACAKLPLRPGERITFEYVLLKGVNDSPEAAKRLIKLLGPVRQRAKVNLIAFNPHPGSEFRRPEERTVAAFQEVLTRADLTTLLRRSMGADILAACGQLRAGAEQPGEVMKTVNLDKSPD